MTRSELTSTERLLNLIKGGGAVRDGAFNPEEKGNQRPGRAGWQESWRKKIRPWLRSDVHAGIIIGKDSVSSVLPGIRPGGEPYVEGIKHVPCPGGTDIHSQQFKQAVSEALAGIGRDRLAGVWCVLPDNMIDVRYIKLPKAGAADLDQAAYWSYKKETGPDRADIVFDYEVQDELTERGIEKLGVCAYGVSKDVVARVRSVLEDEGCTVEGITSGAFAVQSLMASGCIRSDIGNICCLHVGKDSSAIHLYSGAGLVLVRQIRAGLSSLAESLAASGEDEPALQMEDESPPQDPAMERLLRHIRENGDSGDASASDELFPVLRPAVERIARQVERTITYFRQNIKPEKVSSVLVCGQISRYKPFVQAVADFLGIDAYTPKDVLSYDACLVHSENIKEDDLFLVGLGLVRATLGETPNFLFTHVDKKAYSRAVLVWRSVQAAVVAAILACLVAVSWEGSTLIRLKREKARIEAKLPGAAGRLDQAKLGQLSLSLKSRQKVLKNKVGKIEPRVVVGEIINRMPADIKLSGLELDAGKGRNALVSGCVFGRSYTRDSVLASYILDLSRSPLFEQVSIKSRRNVGMGVDGALEFSATIKLSGS
ncbi:MAG: hypothetical protein B5M56_00285 [Desulfococcus sp. 4484_241]|nr:MAG: hypothetical protein B5M56_00285 [Desulfococcus sp. 4484_241]